MTSLVGDTLMAGSHTLQCTLVSFPAVRSVLRDVLMDFLMARPYLESGGTRKDDKPLICVRHMGRKNFFFFQIDSKIMKSLTRLECCAVASQNMARNNSLTQLEADVIATENIKTHVV